MNCGHPSTHDSPKDHCEHIYKPPLEFLKPCERLYGVDVDWVIWTVDNDEQTVFVDSPEFNSVLQFVGKGGIVLRDPQIILKSWPLSDTVNLMKYLNQQYDMSDDEATQIIIILQTIDDLIIAAGDAWPYSELVFRKEDDCPGLRLVSGTTAYLEIVDKLGKFSVSKIMNDIVLHGNWGAKYPLE
jgi:hypothetical protein